MSGSEVEKYINELYLYKALAMRTLSCQIETEKDEVRILSFQCNMARMKTTDLKLPTVIEYTLDKNGIVKDVELKKNFKGSQGIPCSQGYLDKKLKEELIGYNFLEDRSLFRDELSLHCRHTYEVTVASMTLYRYLKEHDLQQGYFYNETRADKNEEGLLVEDQLDFNGIRINTTEKIKFAISDLAMTSDGEIGKMNHFVVEGSIEKNQQIISDFIEEIEHEETPNTIIMSMLKLFHKYWKCVAKELGIDRNFYATNLVPSSIYGVLVQAIALTLYPNNYNYFQHAMAGLQRRKNIPLCVGMVVDFQEIEKYYPELKKYIF